MSVNLQARVEQRLWKAIEGTYQSRNYYGAILDSVHYLGQLIREKSGLESDGTALVGAAFGGRNPVLKVTRLQTESDKNIQAGVEQMLRGFYQAVRNPRSHQTMTDTVEDADALILMVNYLTGLIDQSRSPYERNTFIKRVFDPLFPASSKYAQLLALEVPPGQRLDLLVFVFRQRANGDTTKLPYFVTALTDALPFEELDEFCSIVSEEFASIEDDGDIRSALAILPDALWPRYSELSRRRIENRLIQAIKDGRYDNDKGKCISGGLGTFGSGFVSQFAMRSELTSAIIGRLESTDSMARAFALTYFVFQLPELQPIPTLRLKNAIVGRLRAGDSLMHRTMMLLLSGAVPDEWRDAFGEQCEVFKPSEEVVFSDDDVPF